jgi:hypothetical protein
MASPDPRVDEALDLVRSAMVSLKTALRLIGESRAGQQEAEEEAGPKFFGRKRPTTAVGAESQQEEG